MWRPLTALLLSTAMLAAVQPSSLKGSRPNIILILTDDQGYGDVSVHGNPVLKTPNLDRLHTESIRFTDFHVSPTCAPTRSALLTGRHEFKNGVTHTILERERLTLQATTLAQVLKSAGYATGIFGKWHLGDEPAYQPDQRGFDEVFIHGGGGIGQTYPGSCGDAPGNTYFDPVMLHNGRFETTSGFCTDVFFTRVTNWIDLARKKGPFFAYVACNAPHSPYTARPQDAALYEGLVDGKDLAHFYGMIHNIDQSLGNLLSHISALGIATNTLVVFMSDNGGTAGVRLFNAGMRGSKGTAFLGGTRAISFWHWPERLQPADCPALTAHIDVFPTMAELAEARLDHKVRQQVEGRSLLPLLANPLSATWTDRVLFTHLGRWPKYADPDQSKFAMCSIRRGRWHLVSARGGATPKWQLFDVQADVAELRNVAASNLGIVADLAVAYDHWWLDIKASLINEQVAGPEINPFQSLYYRQFGGGPSAEDLRRMAPVRSQP